MKHTVVKTFVDEYDYKINEYILRMEEDGFEVTNILTTSTYGGDYASFLYIIVVMTKDKNLKRNL